MGEFGGCITGRFGDLCVCDFAWIKDDGVEQHPVVPQQSYRLRLWCFHLPLTPCGPPSGWRLTCVPLAAHATFFDASG